MVCSRDGQFLAKWPGWPYWKQFESRDRRFGPFDAAYVVAGTSAVDFVATSVCSTEAADDTAVSAAVRTGGSPAA
jgi:hypothetical protein